MRYSEDFKQAVRSAFPGWKELSDALDSGSEMVGRCLNDSGQDIPLSRIIDATSLEDLQALARRIAQCRKLYHEWLQLYRARNG